jgi:hypothetical protein
MMSDDERLPAGSQLGKFSLPARPRRADEAGKGQWDPGARTAGLGLE